jgi:hypothetical protein
MGMRSETAKDIPTVNARYPHAEAASRKRPLTDRCVGREAGADDKYSGEGDPE